MITKNDCLSILVQLSDSGVTGAESCIRKLIGVREPTVEVLKFISQNRGLDVSAFYELLRKNYNKKKSDLYINIVKELEDEKEVITTLSCLLTQIILFGNKLENSELFFKQVRAEEISRVLNEYFNTGIVLNCTKLLKLIKTDLLVLEYISGRRDLA